MNKQLLQALNEIEKNLVAECKRVIAENDLDPSLTISEDQLADAIKSYGEFKNFMEMAEADAVDMGEADDKRPPESFMDQCILGVKKSGAAEEPSAVCGNMWFNKMSDADKAKWK